MRKTIKCKPIDDIVLEFENGEEITLRYSMKDLTHFDDFDGGLEGTMKERSIPELCAKVVYVGAVENNRDITIDKVRELVSMLNPIVINQILDEFANSIGTNIEDNDTKKLMAQIIKKIK